ncbi:MAG TPA: metallophosphoesterase, partial [Vicinamibacteria bacterium]|nr:metallophosphoesterase [Vicinamibacteria bacterium]
MYRRVVVHWRAIILLSLLALATFLITHGDFSGLFVIALFLIFIASQLFWIGRILDLGERLIPGKPRRVWLAIIAGLVYLFVIAYSFPTTIGQGHTFRAGYYRLPNIVAEAVFWWWFAGSMLAFALVTAFAIVDRAALAAAWTFRKARGSARVRTPATDSAVADLPLRDRRRLLQQTAVLVSATPFAAAGYGLLYGRLDVEITRPRIRLKRLPKAFDGFRIAQLSDIHISPFTTADHIRHCVTITNGLKADLVVLTGDYLAWDSEAGGEVVRALAGLRAPFGVYGCLGNHEEESGTEESIARSFAAQGIHILRQARAPIQLRGETLNLIGIDEPHGQSAAEWQRDFHRRLRQIGELARPDTVNILLSHSPYGPVVDRAAGL